MLVLSRKPGESLRIGSQVRVTVVSSSHGQVRLAIEAPHEVPVHREEVWERIVQANREAAEASPDTFEALKAARRRPKREGGGR